MKKAFDCLRSLLSSRRSKAFYSEIYDKSEPPFAYKGVRIMPDELGLTAHIVRTLISAEVKII